MLLLFKTTLPTHVRASLLIAEFSSLADSAQEAKNGFAYHSYLYAVRDDV